MSKHDSNQGRGAQHAIQNNHTQQDAKLGVDGDGDTPAVSIVVPVYNVARYLATCLDSLIAQTLENVEIICINDGSTDESPSILRSYAAKGQRIVIIDGPNGGYGHAVNRGLARARGQYVAIVEPDDMVDPHMYEELYRAASMFPGDSADIVKSAYWNYYDLEDGRAPYIEMSNIMDKMPDEPQKFSIHENCELLYQHPSIWSAIYRTDFIRRHNIAMVEAPGAGWVDNPFLFETLCQAQSIVWVPTAYYYYRQTNPDASSYLKDYTIPFKRLDDIRSFLARTHEQDPKIHICLYNRTFDYIKQVLEKFQFPETSEELFGLIRASLEAMDPDILYNAKRGIRRDHIEYYEDVMGITAQKTPPPRRLQQPEYQHHRCNEKRATLHHPLLQKPYRADL